MSLFALNAVIAAVKAGGDDGGDGDVAVNLWRVYMHSTDNIYRFEIMDIEFYDADHVQIPTVGGVADALGSSNLTTYGPENAFDGDSDTHWVGDYQVIPNWLSYELTDPAMVAYVRIIPRTLNRAPTDLSLEHSEDDQTWVEVGRWQTTWPDDTPQEFTVSEDDP